MPLVRLVKKGLSKKRTYQRAAETKAATREFTKFVNKYPAPYRLNLGCGDQPIPNWVNVDLIPVGNVVAWDLTKKIPLPDGTCSFIYSEHVLEHFGITDGMNILKDCYRLLSAGGVLRIAMPSLDDLIARAANGSWKEMTFLTRPEYRHIKTRAEWLNIYFRSWGHQWLYDKEEIQRRMGEAGFSNVRICERSASASPELCNLETRDSSLLVCEARK